MKRIFLLLLLLSSFFVNAQVVNKAEYFIDTDPGAGNGIDIPVGNNAETVVFAAAIPTVGITNGFHNLFVRSRLDDGNWSHLENRVFYISSDAILTTDIATAEYFIDTDPGVGNGTSINVGVAGASVSFSNLVPTTGLSAGFHNLHVRAKNTQGQWSHLEQRVFFISSDTGDAPDVIAAEYFIDTDPGVGNGITLNVGTAGASVNFASVIPTTGLASGFHNLSVRVKNSLGQWSHFENRVFYISADGNAAPDIVAAEFFIDNDPGVGSGTAINIGTSGASVTFTAPLAIIGLSNGFHNLNIRVKNSLDQWSHFENRVFYVSNQGLAAADITDMEYFVDADPGVGNGTAITVAQSASTVTLIATIATTGLTAGQHFLFIRAKSADGWGGFEKQAFTIGAAVAPTKPIIASIDSKTTSPALTNVNKPLIKGTSEPNVTIEVFNGTTSLGTVTADATGNWTFTPTTALADGVLNITTKAKNASNLESVASDIFVVTIDTQAPIITTIVSIDAKATQNFTTANNKPIVVGKAEALSIVEVFNGATKLGEVTADATGNYSFTPLVALIDGNYAITASAKDVAGNVGVKSAGFNFTILTLVPTAPVIVSVDAKTIQNFVTNNNKPIISGTATAAVTVEVFSGATSLGTTTATTGGIFNFTPGTALADGVYTITSKTKNSANVFSLASNIFSFTIDTQVPITPVIVSVVNQTSQNFATNVNRPVITGTGEPGSIIEIFYGGVSLGFATVDASGKFTFTPTTSLPDGSIAITTKAKDAAGNTSSSSTSFTFIVDTQAPIAPIIVNVDGNTIQNFITGNNRPIVIGTAEALASVELFNGTISIGTVNVTVTGNYTFTPASALPDGNYILTAKAKDAANNLSVASTAFSFAIDTKGPTTPVIVSIDGKTTSPAVSRNLKPILVGTAEAGSTISIFNANILIGTVVANANGNWTFIPQTDLAIGTYGFNITAKDAIGNESAKSNVFVYELIPVNKEITANNVLTPNGDGKNDFLVLNNLQYYSKSLIRIYDRAGRTVYTANAYKNDWAGDLNGTILAEGTYYYVVDLGDGFKAFKSFITIVRKSIR